MPLIGIKNELKNGDLQIIPFKGLPIVTNWNLVWQKSKKLSPTALAYLDFIKAEKDRIIQENYDWYKAYYILLTLSTSRRILEYTKAFVFP
jgi:hypothetical protein